MTARNLFAGLLAATWLGSGCAHAQQPGRLPTIGILSPGAPATAVCAPNVQLSTVSCFLAEMRALGYVEGRNVTYEYRYSDGDYAKLPALAAELASLRPNVIYTHTGPGADAAAAATKTVPIVVGPAGEETLIRLAGTLGRPVGNVTGVTLNSIEQDEKCLQLLKQLAPRTSRVALVFNPDNLDYRRYPGVLGAAARQLGLTLVGVEARTVADLPQTLAALEASGANAILFPPDRSITQGGFRQGVYEWASRHQMPIASDSTFAAADGALVSLIADIPSQARRAAHYVQRIVGGAKPGDLPIERPTTYRLSINLKTAKALGLTIPQSLLLRADEVIQ